MSTSTYAAGSETLDQRSKVGWAVQDALAVAHRNLIGLVRVPTTLAYSTVQPVIFVLMFRYVFGGSIQIEGYRYVDYLMAGIFVQTVTFGSINTASAWPRTYPRACWSGSGRSPWPARRCSPAARSPTSCATSSSSC